MTNGKLKWEPLNDEDITLGKVWGVLGVLHERTRVLSHLVTHDQCGLKQAECREAVAEDVRTKEARAGSRRFSALLLVLSCFLTAVLAVAGSAVVQVMIGG